MDFRGETLLGQGKEKPSNRRWRSTAEWRGIYEVYQVEKRAKSRQPYVVTAMRCEVSLGLVRQIVSVMKLVDQIKQEGLTDVLLRRLRLRTESQTRVEELMAELGYSAEDCQKEFKV